MTRSAAVSGGAGALGGAAGPEDGVLQAALNELIPHPYGRGGDAVWLLAAVGAGLGAGLTASQAGLTPRWHTLDRYHHYWLHVFDAIPAVMYRAASPLINPEYREALLDLLQLCVDTGLLTSGSRLRQVTLVGPEVEKGHLIEVGTRRVLVLRHRDAARPDGTGTEPALTALEHAPDGAFGPVPGYRIIHTVDLTDGTLDPAAITRFVRLARERGPVPWRGDLVEAAARAAGVSLAEALLLLGGLRVDHDHDEVAAARAALGLSPAALSVARDTWAGVPRPVRTGMLGALLPADPAALWDDGPQLAGLADQSERRGAPVPDELIVAVHRARVAIDLGASELLHGLANPGTCAWLNRADTRHPHADLLMALARSLPWLAYHLPADDPFRATLPEALARVRALLADPAFQIPCGYLPSGDAREFTDDLGVAPVPGPDGQRFGAFRLSSEVPGWSGVLLHPAFLSGVDDPTLPVLRAYVSGTVAILGALRILLDDPIRELVAAPTSGAAGDQARWPQDPTRSVPGLVGEAATTLGLSPDAAALYLQLLALPDPTNRNVARWTGWKPARLKAARAELAATDLVTEAKRPRAGRSLFLSGGWLALKAPHLPLESWKAPFFAVNERGPLLDVVPVVPVARLFALAWARLRDGDGPRFDEFDTGRLR